MRVLRDQAFFKKQTLDNALMRKSAMTAPSPDLPMLHKSQRSAKMSMTEKGLRDQTQMTFQQTNTLKDNTAKYRTNVEAMARIQISDVEFILAKLKATAEARLRRVLIETCLLYTSDAADE